MRNNAARTFSHLEIPAHTSAEVIHFAQVRADREIKEQSRACDFEAFLSQYGEGIASDFA